MNIETLLQDPARVSELTGSEAEQLLLDIVKLAKALELRVLRGHWHLNGQDDLLTVPEVAKRLKVSEYRAYELVRQGEIKKTVIGGKSVRVTSSALATYIADHGL